MAGGDIPDSSLSASSYQSDNKAPRYARLGGGKKWASVADDSDPWIQVDLGSNYIVTGLLTQGNGNSGDNVYKYWVALIRVQVGFTEGNLIFIEDSQGQPEVC